MKKYIIAFTFIFFSSRAETPVESQFKKPTLAVKTQAPVSVAKAEAPKLPQTTIADRAPAQVLLQVKPNRSRPVIISHLVERDPKFKASTGEWIASNITALPLSSYDPSFGKEISRDKHYAYFAGKTDESVPVAFNPVNQKFHPLSQVLLLKKIDEELRREIVNEGYKEYYYNPRLGLLSIQSSTQEVLSLYSDFKKRGLDVRLEVLKETAQPR